MRRGSIPLLELLVTATLLTVLAVVVGTFAMPGHVRLEAATTGPTTIGGAVHARPTTTSRAADRHLVLARTGTTMDTLPPYHVEQVRQPLRKQPAGPPPPTPGTPFTFQVGTLNVLGSQHTAGKGGYGPGTSRAAALSSAIVSRGVDLLGMQEMQDDQLAVFQHQLPGYGIWPGHALGNNGVRLQIAYRYDTFDIADTGTITTVFDHMMRPIPYVLLTNRATGGQFYVVDVHNSPQGLEAERDQATGSEISLLDSLRATGKPVLLMGDTNEHTEFMCRVAAATGFVAYNGGHYSGGCDTGSGPIKIDWIMGGNGVSFTSPVVDYGAPVPSATDHAFVHATTTITPMVSAGR
ncbi:MAG: endonuclease/exonuclease/phosphatase family protein [Oryzihumus sp.]